MAGIERVWLNSKGDGRDSEESAHGVHRTETSTERRPGSPLDNSRKVLRSDLEGGSNPRERDFMSAFEV